MVSILQIADLRKFDMNIDLSHSRNPLIRWDIQVTVKADTGETITSARIDVNGFPEFDQQISPTAQQMAENTRATRQLSRR